MKESLSAEFNVQAPMLLSAQQMNGITNRETACSVGTREHYIIAAHIFGRVQAGQNEPN